MNKVDLMLAILEKGGALAQEKYPQFFKEKNKEAE